MFGALIIVFREVIEAGLIIGIVLAATRGVSERGRWVSAGVFAGALGAGIVALFAEAIANAFEGAGQDLFNAGVLGAAVAMLMWHAAWMSRHGREMAVELAAAGAAFTALTYYGLVSIPTRHIFTVTTVLIALLAAGMAAQAVQYLDAAGLINVLSGQLWDSSPWLPQDGIVGRVLHALIGYTDRPTELQLITYLATLAAMAALTRLATPAHTAQARAL